MVESPRKARHFGSLVIKFGFASPQQVEECLKLQEEIRAKGGTPPKLGEIMLQKKYITKKQMDFTYISHLIYGYERKVNGYYIVERIGQGTLGVVFKAMQVVMNRMVALKILFPKFQYTQEVEDVFLKEIQLIAKITHPHIVFAIDAGRWKDLFYYTMELVEGTSLTNMIQKGPVPEKTALNIGIQIARAISYLARHEIVHRDIKPGNILIAKDQTAKLCDLGLARVVSSMSASSGQKEIVGTPYYISPEQVRMQENIDFRSDIYALGATLYHALTGEPVFQSTSLKEIFKLQLSALPVPLRKKNPAISPFTEFIVMKMLQKNPDDRYRSVEDLIQDMEAASRDSPPKGFLYAEEVSEEEAKPAKVAQKIRRVRRFRRR